jgi:hypothetical protein
VNVYGSYLGAAVALFGGRLFVGAPFHSDRGAVFVFEQQGSAWVQVQRIDPPPSATSAGQLQFGWALEGAGDRLLVSAPGQAETAGSGRVHDFRSESGSFTPIGSIVPPAYLPPVSSFGRSLDHADGRLAVGGLGWALTFWELPSSWIIQTAYTYPDEVTYSDFGRAVALYGDGLLAGAPQWDPNESQYPNGTGAVHAYDTSDFPGTLIACGHSISVIAGGAEKLLLNAPAHPNDTYWVLGSVSGTGPLPIAPGLALPLTPDAYFTQTLVQPGGPFFSEGFGTLGAIGEAYIDFVVPSGLPVGLVGLEVHHAFVALDAGFAPQFVSNAVAIELVL